MRYCVKLTGKDISKAKDLYQDSVEYMLTNDVSHITHLDTYLKLLIKGRYLNSRRNNSNKVFIDSSEYQDYFQYAEEESFDREQFLKIIEIIEKICYPKEKQAIYHVLNTDNMRVGINGGSFETLKANRRFGIQKVIKYLKERGEYYE